MNFSDKIKFQREQNHLTQKELAQYLGCDQSLYSKYERAERLLPLDLAVSLAKFYHVSLDYLVGIKDEK